ncbi:MAG: UDP-N-acetylmuramoyl-L-alanyl-D-glutamate--2,6-diaminopimelate ligase [Oscillospiraceae bacterium]|nr:UDP-N-acetylmuramoyl-L-alanyl-D-glutamate--2,6-diaminopimelate ligase [Oscillospiraceae bacterium]
MFLSELLQGVEQISASGTDPAMEISGVSYDSRRTKPGDLFVAMTGYETDGHKYIPMAVKKGAVCVLCEKMPEEKIPCVLTPDSRTALAVVGKNWFRNPAAEMTLTGITGTNGKTTTTYLLKDILEQCLKAKVGLIGTNQNMTGGEIIPTERTTPESFELQGLFRRMRDAGCTHVVMEVSSHALFLKRVYGVEFEVGVFTNLTQDHLDFHGTMENYCDAKGLLFRQCRTGVYNAGDPWAGRVMEQAACKKVSFGEGGADVSASEIRLNAAGVSFTAACKDETVPVHVGIPGGFMVSNTLAVLAAAKALGVSLKDSAAVLRHSAHVKGRVEPVPVPGNYTMLIDYAHTPDALENVLNAVRGFAEGRVVVLFGCGGDRDRTKRPLMGNAAARLADFVIVTSDNPRTENPSAIIADILAGMRGAEEKFVVVENRVEAIHYAMDHARDGDVIVLAGKGHETYQIVGHEKRHLDEREIVAEYAVQQEERA